MIMTNVITLLSNASSDLNNYKNTLNNFVNVLPRKLPLKRRTNMGVALESISFTSHFTNLPADVEEHGANGQHHFWLKFKVSQDVRVPPKFFKFSIPKIRYETLADLCSVLSASVPFTYLVRGERVRYVQFIEDVGSINIVLNNCHFAVRSNVISWFGLQSNPKTLFKRLAGYPQYMAAITEEGRKNKIILEGQTHVQLREVFPTYVKVCLDGLYNVVGSSRHANVLAVIPYLEHRHGGRDPLFSYEVDQKVYGLIDLRNRNSLRVTLRDQNDEKLKLDHGQASIVRLSLHRMVKRSFTLRLSSKDTDRILEGGTNSDFEYMFGEPLNLAKKAANRWEMALVSVIFPMEFKRYKRPDDRHTDIVIAEINHAERDRHRPYPEEVEEMLTEEELAELDLWQASFRWSVSLQDDWFKDEETLMAKIRQKVHNETRDALDFNFDIQTRYITIRCDADYALAGTSYHASINPRLAFLMGLSSHLGNKNILLSLTSGQEYTFPRTFDLNRLLPINMFLYCNIIEAPVYGDGYANVVKVIPLHSTLQGERKNQDVNPSQLYECEHLNFIKLSRSHIPSIQLKLANSLGETIHFNHPHDEVLYTFMFRMK